MAARTYLFRWIKSWRNPITYGTLPAKSKMNTNSKSKLCLYVTKATLIAQLLLFRPTGCYFVTFINFVHMPSHILCVFLLFHYIVCMCVCHYVLIKELSYLLTYVSKAGSGINILYLLTGPIYSTYMTSSALFCTRRLYGLLNV